MPGGRSKPTETPRQMERRLIFGQTGEQQPLGESSWDPKPEPFAEAVTMLIASGCAVMFSSAGGGRMIGATIYEGDHKHPRKWLYDSEELDEWSLDVIARLKAARGEK